MNQHTTNGDAPSSDDQIREWLRWVLRIKNMRPTPLAKAAGLSPSTLLRALDEENPVSLERRSIEKIVECHNVPGPGATFDVHPRRTFSPAGFPEPELSLLPAEHRDPLVSPPSETQTDWVVASRALELVGILPGDVVRIDTSLTPRLRDVVAAEIVRSAGSEPVTALRVYDPPYLLTAAMHPNATIKPALVDNNIVRISGVMVRTWRVRA